MKREMSLIELLEKMSTTDIEKQAHLLKHKYKIVFDKLAKL